MIDPVELALEQVRNLSASGALRRGCSVTLNFHPDVVDDGGTMISGLARDRVYRSQFETGTSNGGLTAYPGGDRWKWESRIFGTAYDRAPPGVRPKYGALAFRSDLYGGSPRFGSCYVRLREEVLGRTTFCYPDSHFEPSDFGIGERCALADLADKNVLGLDTELDNYVEAHVHGPLVASDFAVVVLDPSYRGTAIEDAARMLGCEIGWHAGFRLPLTRLEDCVRFRGDVVGEAIRSIASNGQVTPAVLGSARHRSLDYQTAKWVWHCVAKYGRVS